MQFFRRISMLVSLLETLTLQLCHLALRLAWESCDEGNGYVVADAAVSDGQKVLRDNQ